MLRWNFLCSSLCPLPFVLPQSITEKRLALYTWHSPFRYLGVDRVPSQSSPGWTVSGLSPFLIMEMFYAFIHICGPLLDFIYKFSVFLKLRSQELDTPDVALPGLPLISWAHSLIHPSIPLAFLATVVHCLLMAYLLCTRTPMCSSIELLSSRLAPKLYWCMWLFLPVWDSKLALVEPHQVLCPPLLCVQINMYCKLD